MVFGEGEDGFDVFFGPVVAEEGGLGGVPVPYYFFSLPN
jgi:hypothetical protein